MIIDAIVKTAVIDKDHKRVELFSPKYPMAKALVLLDMAYEGKKIQFITGWEDVIKKKRPFTINGGAIPDDIVGKSTLIRGMCVQCTDDPTVYVVMDPVLLK
jgi:hypothetical protein